eukprot:EG_transcript_17208
MRLPNASCCFENRRLDKTPDRRWGGTQATIARRPDPPVPSIGSPNAVSRTARVTWRDPKWESFGSHLTEGPNVSPTTPLAFQASHQALGENAKGHDGETNTGAIRLRERTPASPLQRLGAKKTFREEGGMHGIQVLCRRRENAPSKMLPGKARQGKNTLPVVKGHCMGTI